MYQFVSAVHEISRTFEILTPMRAMNVLETVEGRVGGGGEGGTDEDQNGWI